MILLGRENCFGRKNKFSLDDKVTRVCFDKIKTRFDDCRCLKMLCSRNAPNRLEININLKDLTQKGRCGDERICFQIENEGV